MRETDWLQEKRHFYVFPTKAHSHWLCHKQAFYLEIRSLDFSTNCAQISFRESSPTLRCLTPLLMFTRRRTEGAQFCLLLQLL